MSDFIGAWRLYQHWAGGNPSLYSDTCSRHLVSRSQDNHLVCVPISGVDRIGGRPGRMQMRRRMDYSTPWYWLCAGLAAHGDVGWPIRKRGPTPPSWTAQADPKGAALGVIRRNGWDVCQMSCQSATQKVLMAFRPPSSFPQLLPKIPPAPHPFPV